LATLPAGDRNLHIGADGRSRGPCRRGVRRPTDSALTTPGPTPASGECPSSSDRAEGATMSDEIKGKVDNLKGRAKQAAGSISGDKGLEAEGAAQRIKGAVQEKVGEAKRKLRDDNDPKAPDDDEEENKEDKDGV
jgi:uncharacterized protein YjbJ (UPF0337 family)